MPLYECELCNYNSKIKTHFNRHINTPKHKRKYLDSKSKINDKDIQAIASIKVMSNVIHGEQTNIEDTHNKDAIKCIEEENWVCDLCGRQLSTKGHLTRHMKTYCPALNTNNNKDTCILKDILEVQQQQFANERATLYKQIEKLLDKVGNTTNIQSNIKNTITLNSYGNENMSHITDKLKTQLVKLPYGMIPKLIEAVHFNDKHPENKNIALTNSRDNKIKVFSDNKWIYRDKEETINDLVDGKYYILDTHFEEVNESLQADYKSNFVKFKEYFSSEDKEFCNKLKRDCEIVLLNNR